MSDEYGIKREWKEAWSDSYQIYPWKLLADLSLHLLAKLMESEFKWEHETHITSIPSLPDKYCAECDQQSNWNPRHNYTYDAWLAEAKGWLGK